MFEIKISKCFTPGLGELFWSVFFESRGRGISLTRHFPWLFKPDEEITFVSAEIAGEVVGGLVLHRRDFIVDNEMLRIGIIGLVAVAPDKRGLGIARELLSQAVVHAKHSGLQFLTLWTNKHDVYARHGFLVNDQWNYGWVKNKRQDINCLNSDLINRPGLIESQSLPLPPFASAVYELRPSKNCSLVLVADVSGFVVVGYEGDCVEAGLTMVDTFPGGWRLNAVDGDPIIDVLTSNGMSVALSPANLQMWMSLKYDVPADSIAKKIKFSVLDRI